MKIKSIRAFAITNPIAGGTYEEAKQKGTARRPPWTKDAEVANLPGHRHFVDLIGQRLIGRHDSEFELRRQRHYCFNVLAFSSTSSIVPCM